MIETHQIRLRSTAMRLAGRHQHQFLDLLIQSLHGVAHRFCIRWMRSWRYQHWARLGCQHPDAEKIPRKQQ